MNYNQQKGLKAFRNGCLFSYSKIVGGGEMKWKDAGDINAAELSDEHFKTFREMTKKPKFDHYEREKKKKKKRKVNESGVR